MNLKVSIYKNTAMTDCIFKKDDPKRTLKRARRRYSETNGSHIWIFDSGMVVHLICFASALQSFAMSQKSCLNFEISVLEKSDSPMMESFVAIISPTI